MKNIVILGSTGTIGKNTLEIIRNNDENKFSVLGLACKSDKKTLYSQIKEFHPAYVYIEKKDVSFASQFPDIKFLYGDEGLIEIATLKESDLIIAAIPGIKTLTAILESLKKGRTIGLATKEIMVVAGQFIMETAKKYRATILPVDSEHNAIFQILDVEKKVRSVEKIYLTASGGPFLGRKDLKGINRKQVLAHPVWKMGKTITVDSATLMNKAFEIIEAHYFFSLPSEKIDVLIHPEAIVHGLVEFVDGVLKGVFSYPDMKFAISFVLNYPERIENKWERVNLGEISKLTFRKVNDSDIWFFLAKKALEEKGSFPIVLNGANEEAVNLFLKGRIKFHQILHIVGKVMSVHKVIKNISLSDIFEIDRWVKREVRTIVKK